LRKLIKNCEKYKQWQRSCFTRDNWMCVKCKNKNKLHVHHLRRFSIIYNDFLLKYSHLSPEKDKEELNMLSREYNDFWDISNGQTLCYLCHQKEHPEINLTLK